MLWTGKVRDLQCCGLAHDAPSKQPDGKLVTVLARAVEQRIRELNAQELANTARAFATVKQSDEKLFTVWRGQRISK